MNPRGMTMALAVCCLAGAASAADMQPGKWEYTMKTVVPGVPFTTPRVTAPVCLSAEDVKYGVAWSNHGHKGDCHYRNLRQSGATTRYDMVCHGKEAVRGRFEFTSTADSVQGKGLLDTGQTQVTEEWSGKRIGDC